MCAIIVFSLNVLLRYQFIRHYSDKDFNWLGLNPNVRRRKKTTLHSALNDDHNMMYFAIASSLKFELFQSEISCFCKLEQSYILKVRV